MHFISFFLFCLLYCFTLCSNPDYEFLRGSNIAGEDYAINGDADKTFNGNDERVDNDDDNDIGKPIKLEGSDDNSDETNDSDGGFVGTNNKDLGSSENLNDNDDLDVEQYKLEVAAGDLSEFLGSAHHHDPLYYKDLSRRFVPVYPYVKRKPKLEKPVLEDILQVVATSKKSLRDSEEKEIIPIRAPKDVVLAVMKNGTKTYSSKPSEPTEEVIRQYMLRSGDYWDNVWKEEVNPDTILRTKKQHKQTSANSGPITAKLVPGTKLYNALASTVKKSPKLVYIISN